MKAVTGYIGVINGSPVFEKTGDDKGDFRAFDIFKTKQAAFARWDRVRKVRVIIGQKDVEIPNRGKL